LGEVTVAEGSSFHSYSSSFSYCWEIIDSLNWRIRIGRFRAFSISLEN
jgi:hypothetical protein